MVQIKLIPAILLLFALSCKVNEPCIDESIKSEGPCTMDYRPVCGCDGETYSNACVAKNNGLLLWTDGACPE